MNKQLPFVFNDGGRAAAGFKGKANDCVARAIAIAAQRPYAEIYSRLAAGADTQRVTAKTAARHTKRSAAHGILTGRKWFADYMAELGFAWFPTMAVGQGCQTHLAAGEIPNGRIIVSVSKHYAAVLDGVIHDTFDPGRAGTRCVYGYWRLMR